LQTKVIVSVETALECYQKTAPILRGLLAIRTKNNDCPYQRVILKPLITKETIDFVNSDRGKKIALTPPLTSDHLIRTKSFPLWIDDPQYHDDNKLRDQIASGINEYVKQYNMYVERNAQRVKTGLSYIDPMPRIIMIQGIGIICSGKNIEEAELVSDIAAQTIQVKSKVAAMGTYEALSEEHLFDMEYFSLQHAKLNKDEVPALKRTVALITGAAGAIGTGICQGLLENGCHVAITDLPGENLNSMENEFKTRYGVRVISLPLDVTKPGSVAKGFTKVIETWGGIDLLIVNAGIAHVSPLADMKLSDFRKLEEVNIEGTLNVLSEISRFFKIQGTGGDIVLISTKNVFSPGAKFGAYSATKAAAHQLARIASLELAEIGVRVNMVAPDAVFSHGKHKSGLWAKVGPDRMLARGLDEKGLEDYYQNRNLLKAKVTATHVSNAVIYFATRQSPTTGATIPVDGGLPDSIPR
jgi:NAD(P)-dependent dehydrogenase (short-subunit alcohol dehydrogenase family)